MTAPFIFIAMVIFAVVSSITGRRQGNGISRHPYGDIYTDAPAARTPGAEQS